MRIDWSELAVSDLRNISEYIERDRGISTTNRITRALYDAIQSLRRFPYRGRYGRFENTRELVLPPLPWIMVYSVSDARVVILNIVHGDAAMAVAQPLPLPRH